MRTLRWLAAALMAAGMAAGAVTPASADQRALTVLSFNIHHAEGTDGALDLDRIARVIDRSGADVAGLQEVDRHYSDRSAWADQARELARKLGYHVVFGANIDDPPSAPGERRVQYGTAILSRYPIVDSSNTYLHRSPDQEQRGLLHAELNIRGERVHVYDTHLAASSQSDRAAQGRQVADIIGDTRRAVLVGDLNAEPGAPELAPIDRALTDVWPAVGEGDGPTLPSEEPEKRIDYVYAGDDVTPVAARVLDEEPEASDHLPVVAELDIG
ncbi:MULTISPECIES: endonuclease/exonuclease/phosphatase family protein [Prauserella salsuginis group]|uniref:Endonuclease/exonuclease/phosphatase family protein n=1 Tax=Prauserella salsuginis TaxID=387889 RepID=A0ABW6GB66_9PSEU|nr:MULTISPECIES: endonuclease/exonuclease/phosphatase family protein [Prauserella salsuginis group]MCR3719053.1 Metal-dependent hydrolase, endonuclease/exonuclease/phosphatase family [Prauserella flava]MCR3733623.1 Metal-dependent hydrolase, endonuclease/exonuclease/phosphatase family [Prauserella salsuginis]